MNKSLKVKVGTMFLLFACLIPTTFAQSTLCNQLEGLKLYSNEDKPVFLGTFTSNRYDSDGISNKYGDYGNKYASSSIFNQYGNYGSKYSSYSPWNKYASTAPYLVDDKFNILGVLTNNKYQTNAVSTIQALSCIMDFSDDRLTPYFADNPVNDVNSDSNVGVPISHATTQPLTTPIVFKEFLGAITEVSNTNDQIQLAWSFPNAISYSVFVIDNSGIDVLKYIDISDTSRFFDKSQLKVLGSGKIEVDAYDSTGKHIGYSNYLFNFNGNISSPLQNQTNFNDIELSNYKNAIIYLKQNGIVSGYDDGSFKPLNPINRAEFTKIVVGTIEPNPSGSSCFSDVKDEWFAPYVCYAKANNVIGGYNDGSFKPNQNINLAEALKIVLLALKIDLSSNAGSNWYDVYLNTATSKNLLNLVDKTIDHYLTRGEMAQLIYNIKK